MVILVVLFGVFCTITLGYAAPAKSRDALEELIADGKASLAKSPLKDKVLWHYRIGAVAMRAGNWSEARTQFDAALSYLNQLAVNFKGAKDARALFGKEADKLFIGEPYERVMAYFYRGLIYWHDGEFDNARACFRSMAIIGSDQVDHAYTSDWNVADYLDGAATVSLGGDGADEIARASRRLGTELKAKGRLLVVEFGEGPQKYLDGEHHQILKFYAEPPAINRVKITVGASSQVYLPMDDIYYHATTRGGRIMDYILNNKVVFKDRAEKFGVGAMAVGAAAMASGDKTARTAGGILEIAGMISYLAGAATNTRADNRMWDNLPRYIVATFIEVPPEVTALQLEFLQDDKLVSSKPVVVATGEAKDPIIFFSNRTY